MKKIILVILLVMVLPFNGYAAEITIKGAGFGQETKWIFQKQEQSDFAGQIQTSLGIAYCVELSQYIEAGKPYTYEDYSWKLPETYQTAAMLMDQFGGSITQNVEAAGLQAAIWEIIFGEAFEFQDGKVAEYQNKYLVSFIKDPTVVDRYAILNLGDSQDLLVRVESVPEPGTMLLLGLGLLGLGITTRRKS